MDRSETSFNGLNTSFAPLRGFLTRDRRGLIRYVLASFLMLTDSVGMSITTANMIGAAAEKNFGGILVWAGVGLALLVAGRLLYYISRTERTAFARDRLIDLRCLAFERILAMSQPEFNRRSRDVYVSRLTNDINTFESKMFNAFLRTIYNGGVAVVALAVMTLVNPIAALIVLVFAVVYVSLSRFVFADRISARQLEVSAANEEFVIRASNTINGSEIIKLNRIEDRFIQNLMNDAELLERKKFSRNFFENIVQNMMSLLAICLQVTLIGYLFVWISGPGDISGALLVILLSDSVIWPMQSLFENYTILKSCGVLYNKIIAEAPEVPETADRSGDAILPDGRNRSGAVETGQPFVFEHEIRLEDVSIRHGNKRVLDGVNLSIAKGEKWRLEGASGSGKSTLLRILARSEDGGGGRYTLDGVDADQIDIRSFYEKVAVIDQNIYLFEDSLRDNITLYHDYTPEAIRRAVEAAGLSDLVDSLESGLDYRLTEDGRNLSGGQRQRVAIARAIIKDADLLLVDEATSSLDEQTGAQIEETLLSLSATVISVSHRFYPGVSDRYDGRMTIEDGAVTMVRRPA